MSSGASAQARTQKPKSDTASTPASAAAAAAAREQARARRRQRAGLRGHGDKFMDMNFEVDPDWGATTGEEPVASTVASDQSAGTLGFAGTVRRETVAEAAGLTTLAGDEFGGGPTMPMMPGTWDPEESINDGPRVDSTPGAQPGNHPKAAPRVRNPPSLRRNLIGNDDA
ncbi:hypothetical protein [Mycobacterium avium]